MNICTFFSNTWLLILIMFVAGFFGGTVNYFQSYDAKTAGWVRFWRCVIVGLGASYLVPLFLKMISSDLLKISGVDYAINLLIFFGICLVSAIFSRRFIETIGERILNEAKEAKKEVQEVKKDAADAIDKTDDNDTLIEGMKDELTKLAELVTTKLNQDGNKK